MAWYGITHTLLPISAGGGCRLRPWPGVWYGMVPPQPPVSVFRSLRMVASFSSCPTREASGRPVNQRRLFEDGLACAGVVEVVLVLARPHSQSHWAGNATHLYNNAPTRTPIALLYRLDGEHELTVTTRSAYRRVCARERDPEPVPVAWFSTLDLMPPPSGAHSLCTRSPSIRNDLRITHHQRAPALSSIKDRDVAEDGVLERAFRRLA
jgi:hypothetical protein